MKELICIVCPKGCHLKVDEENGYNVSGNACQRGVTYGKEECTAPVRVVTSTVAVSGGTIPRVSVKTNSPVPKGDVFNVVRILDNIQLKAPVKIGDIVVSNICNSGANVVVTSNIAVQI